MARMPLGFGLMRLPKKGDALDTELIKKMVDRFIQSGFRYFDTAYPYHDGASEEMVREAIVSRYPREDVFLTTKMPIWEIKEYADHEKYFQIALDRTGAGYFDNYLLHNLSEDRIENCEKCGSWEFLREMKAKGLIRHYGFSFHDTPEHLDEILTKHPEAEFVQLQINYADWENKRIQSRRCYEVARKHHKPIIVMEPIKGGSLATLPEKVRAPLTAYAPHASVASWALRFVSSLEGVMLVLSGMSDMEQLEDNIKLMSDFHPLDAKEKALLESARAEIERMPAIPCTRCEYCLSGCPEKIDIPSVLSALSTYQVFENTTGARTSYGWATRRNGKASACRACGACEAQCPQHLHIIELLKKAASVLE